MAKALLPLDAVNMPKLAHRWDAQNRYRRKIKLDPISFRRWLNSVGYDAIDIAIQDRLVQGVQDFRDDKDYRRSLNKRDGTYRQTRLQDHDILSPTKVKNITMENDSTTQHLYDKMVRQEGGTHFGRPGGWFSLGDGGFMKGKSPKGGR